MWACLTADKKPDPWGGSGLLSVEID